MIQSPASYSSKYVCNIGLSSCLTYNQKYILVIKVVACVLAVLGILFALFSPVAIYNKIRYEFQSRCSPGSQSIWSYTEKCLTMYIKYIDLIIGVLLPFVTLLVCNIVIIRKLLTANKKVNHLLY